MITYYFFLSVSIQARFEKGHIYTYVGSILIAVNPFKFYPIYNPKYVQLYQNRRLGELPPHIFAIADAAYQVSTSLSIITEVSLIQCINFTRAVMGLLLACLVSAGIEYSCSPCITLHLKSLKSTQMLKT